MEFSLLYVGNTCGPSEQYWTIQNLSLNLSLKSELINLDQNIQISLITAHSESSDSIQIQLQNGT